MTINKGMSRKRDDICTTVSRLTGYSYDYVRRVRNGERENELVLEAIMELVEGRTKLQQKVAELVPINEKVSAKRGRLAHKDQSNQLIFSY